jgi:hypothetical protein
MKSIFPFVLALVATSLPTGAGTTIKFSSSNLPYPFAPPSDDFCDFNTLGDDVYVSAFVPCDFVFYDTKVMPEHFSCESYDKSTAVIKKERRKIVMWPESCVAAGPRCYSIKDNPTLYNYTLFNDTEFAMEFPKEATVVSVDCTADFAKVNEFIQNLPEELADVAASISFAAGVFLFAVIAAIVACICCCFGACRRNRHSSPEATYMAVPSHIVKAQPVHSTTVYGAQQTEKEML